MKKVSQLIAAAILAVPAVSPSTATAAPHPPAVSINLDERGRPQLPPVLAQALELGLANTEPDQVGGINIGCGPNGGC